MNLLHLNSKLTCFYNFLQVKFAVFWIYVKSVGVILSLVTVFFFVLYNGASVYTNVWLSEWSNDRPIIRNGTNGTLVKEVDISKRNMRLWMYGVLGLLQGISRSLILFSKFCQTSFCFLNFFFIIE